MIDHKDYIYDIETYPNCFTLCATYKNGKSMKVFEISDRKDQTEELLEFFRNVKRHECRMVGFNNVRFDYPVIHFILQKARECFKDGTKLHMTANKIYQFAMSVIESGKSEDTKFKYVVKQDDVILPQVDLFLINHFDNKARSTSLKMLEFNMRSDDIQDLPFPVGKILTPDEMDTLITYNMQDVLQTLKFYDYCTDALDLRDQLTELYGFDCTNFNDTKIGKQLFINTLEKENPGCCYTVTDRGRKMNQTKRKSIKIKDCLLDYIKFDNPEFKAVHEWLLNQTIQETKGVFTEIDESRLGTLADHSHMITKRKKFKGKPTEAQTDEFMEWHPKGWIEEVELKSTEYVLDEEGNFVTAYPVNEFGVEDRSKQPKKLRRNRIAYWACWNEAESLNAVKDGKVYYFGTGGIHMSIDSAHVQSKDDYLIIDADVASMYPNVSISNNFYPEHLGKTFCDVYRSLYEQRKSHPKGTPANAALKLALNGVYGDSNSEYSPLYDPMYTMRITLNGQMLLLMLVESLIGLGADIIQCNTDGVTVGIHVSKQDEYYKVCKEWEGITGLQLEYAKYTDMFIRDVNNYIAVYEGGKVKLKGAYEYNDYTKLGWHKNHSAMIIPMAVEAHLVHGKDYEEFIRFHDNPFDFMLRTKVPRNSSLVLIDSEGNEEQLQNICRYYPCKTGGKLVKIMPPTEGKEEDRRIGIDSEWNVAVCNNMLDYKGDIDYDYYYQKAKELIDKVKVT